MDKIKKSALVKKSDDSEKQGDAIKEACDREAGQPLTFVIKPGRAVRVDKSLEVVITIELA